VQSTETRRRAFRLKLAARQEHVVKVAGFPVIGRDDDGEDGLVCALSDGLGWPNPCTAGRQRILVIREPTRCTGVPVRFRRREAGDWDGR
jgi:hypothetical protein